MSKGSRFTNLTGRSEDLPVAIDGGNCQQRDISSELSAVSCQQWAMSYQQYDMNIPFL